MKKKLVSLLIILSLTASIFSAGIIGFAEQLFIKPSLTDLVAEETDRFAEELPTGNVTVSFSANGGILGGIQGSVTIEAGNRLTKPALNPTKSSMYFERWCLDAGGKVPWDFSDPVYNNMTLYAKYNNGAKYTKLSEEPFVISEDYAKYNASRELNLKNEIINSVRAGYAGQPAAVRIDNMNTLELNASKNYPTGNHTVSLITDAAANNKYNFGVQVASADANKIYVTAKATASDLGGAASGYFNGAKDIGIDTKNYFHLENVNELTDYKITNAGARDLHGLPEDLLSRNNMLKQFTDPILIRNGTGKDIWLKPEDTSAAYLFFNANGLVKMGYSGADSVLIDETNYNVEKRKTNASTAFISNRKLENGGFLLVVAGNSNKGNFYTPEASNTYASDGRQFVYNTMMYRYNNAVQVRVGSKTAGTLLTGAYTNQMPYQLKGFAQRVAYVDENVTINKAYALNGVEIYDDNVTFSKDNLIASANITVAFAALENETDDVTAASYSLTPIVNPALGYYSARFTVNDNVTSEAVHFYRSILIKEIDNDYTFYTLNGEKKVFVHSSAAAGDTIGVKFNTQYNSTTAYKNSVFAYGHTSNVYFGSVACMYSAILLVKSDGSVVIAVEPRGTVYGADGAVITTIDASKNMVPQLIEHYTGSYSGTTAEMQSLISTAFGTDTSGTGTYYLLVYPNVGSTPAESPSRQFAWDFINEFISDAELKINIKGAGITVGA